MKVLVVGSSGATGKQLIEQLIQKGHTVRAIVRKTAKLPQNWLNAEKINLVYRNILEIDQNELVAHLKDCQAIALTLGHNLTLKGIFGHPAKLVTQALSNLTKAAEKNAVPMKIVLMNTAGNRNPDMDKDLSFNEKLATSIIRVLLPPHSDNEQAAEFLRSQIGSKNKNINWVIVRPDSLIDSNVVTGYKAYPSPTRSAIFNPGKVSRINVGHFMASLISDEHLWIKWMGQMPVLYNS